MECFNGLLLKLKEVHEREVEGWQMKTQELSNKKGCDTKRMEELFSKNQQMKEQQRLLTENIKTLENRLRAGLCDRCTVTQEVAKRRQQEFEASQVQNLQHISLLAAELNTVKKDNKRLREEIRNLRSTLDSPSSSGEVKVASSPDLSPSGPACSRMNRPAGGDISIKAETEQHAEESDVHSWRGNRNSFESYKPVTSLSGKPEQQGASQPAERRCPSVQGLDHKLPHPLHIRTSSSSPSNVTVAPSRHGIHTSILCRPQPIRSSPGSSTWPLSDLSDWMNTPVSTLVTSPSVKPHPLRYPNIIGGGPQSRMPAMSSLGSVWSRQSPLKTPKEPTVLFRLKGVPDGQTKNLYKKEETADRIRDGWEGPLDLSERGKSKTTPCRDDSEIISDSIIPKRRSDPPAEVMSEPLPSSSPSPTNQNKALEEDATKHDHTITTGNKGQAVTKQTEEINGQMEQKKVPVLTLSLRPVVVLESLNSALQKQDSSPERQSSSLGAETGSSSDGAAEDESTSDPETKKRCARKRTCEEAGSENVQPQRKVQITVRTPEKNSS